MELTNSITGPVAVIGDVHGHVDKVRRILDQLARLPDFERRWIVFIGDLVDRGPDPKGTLDLVLELMRTHPKTAAVAGNHELAMSASLGCVPVPEYSDWSKRWLDHYGAQSTFHSYGANWGDLHDLAAKLPAEHRQYFADLPWGIEHPEYYFVHAGLDPHKPFAVQQAILHQRDFSLSRPPWLCSKQLTFDVGPPDCHLTTISGHVRVPQVQFSRRRILIDTTGGEADGVLSCVLLPEHEVLTSA